MSELRLRAWDREANSWLEGNMLTLHCSGRLINVPPQLVLMQWTGLKDATGKDIYEGDIVKMPDAKQAMWVEYQPPAFVMRFKTPSGRKSQSWSTFDLDYREPQFVEVIGNIYEHPELLEQEVSK